MKFYQETTNYKDAIPNGTYLLSDDKSKMYAFIKAGSKSVFTFKNPIRVDTRGRTFKLVDNTFNYTVPGKDVNTNPRWEVKGSKGDTYIVEKTENGLTCTCSGFKFRAKCKHSDKYK
jgi:hypothetical protein